MASADVLEQAIAHPIAHPFRGRLSRCGDRYDNAGNDRVSCALTTGATRSPGGRRTGRRPCTGRSAKRRASSLAREGTARDKGQTLEELAGRLFNTVPGFAATGHVFTETEEIDIRIQNASDDHHWRRESYLLVAECKKLVDQVRQG